MGTILLLAGSLVPASLGGAELKRFEYQQILMGVPVKIVVYSAGEPLANSAVHAAFDRIRQLNLIFSDYDDESEISRLCRTSGPGRPVSVSPELADVLADIRSSEVSRRSEGAFDVTVGPLVSLWRKARRAKKLPNPETLAAAKQRVGYQFVRLDERARTVELLKPGMRLDFGGIVKGYAADQAQAVLKASQGLPQAALVRISVAISPPASRPPGQSGWRIGLQGLGAEGEAAARRNFSLLEIEVGVEPPVKHVSVCRTRRQAVFPLARSEDGTRHHAADQCDGRRSDRSDLGRTRLGRRNSGSRERAQVVDRVEGRGTH